MEGGVTVDWAAIFILNSMPESITPTTSQPSDGTGKPGAVALRFSMLIVLLLTLVAGGYTGWAIYDLIQNPNSGDLNALYMPLTFLTFTAGIMVLYQMWRQSRRAYKTLIYAAIFPVLWTASSSLSFTLPYDLIYPSFAILIIIALVLYWRVPKID
jgi:hypothetical protein